MTTVKLTRSYHSMSNFLRRLMIVAVLGLMAMMLSGCWLRLLVGQVIYTDSEEEEATAIDMAVQSGASVGVCYGLGSGEHECTYVIGGQIVTSSFQLALAAGDLAAIIDPIVLQVPDSITSVSGTYDDGSGLQLLQVRSGLQSVAVDSTSQFTPEPGHHLAVVEFPSDVELPLSLYDPERNGKPFDFTLHLNGVQPINAAKGPIELKAVFTGRVDANGQAYYVPIFPCTSDFTQVPSIEIPKSPTLMDIAPSQSLMTQNANSGCMGTTTYTFMGVPSVETFLPMIIR